MHLSVQCTTNFGPLLLCLLVTCLPPGAAGGRAPAARLESEQMAPCRGLCSIGHGDTGGAWVSRADCGWPARQLMTGLAGDETSSTDGSSRLVNTCGCWLLGAAANYPVPGLSLSVPGWLSRSTFIPLSDPDVSIYCRGPLNDGDDGDDYIITEEGHFLLQDLNGTGKSKLTHPAEPRTRKGKNKKRRGRGPVGNLIVGGRGGRPRRAPAVV